MASIKDFVNKAKKTIRGKRNPSGTPKADARTMHAQRNNGTTGQNTVPGESYAQTKYRAAKINAAREAYAARKAGKTTQSAPSTGASTQSRSASAKRVHSPKPDNVYGRKSGPQAKKPDNVYGKKRGPHAKKPDNVYGNKSGPQAKKPDNVYGNKSKPAAKSKPVAEKSLTFREAFAQQTSTYKRYGSAAGQPGNKPKAQQKVVTKKPTSKKTVNPRSRGIVSGKSSSTQSAVRDLSKRRKNKVKGQR